MIRSAPRAFLFALALMAFGAGVALAQAQPNPALKIDGLVANAVTLGASDFAAPRHSVTVTDEAGTKTTYDGVEVVELLRRAGAPLGKQLKGPNIALCVIGRGSDGYRAAFALADLDPGIGGLEVIVADRRDGKPLDSREGPLRLVVPTDKRHARWVRGVISLSVASVR
jgi:hypothetical protein